MMSIISKAPQIAKAAAQAAPKAAPKMAPKVAPSVAKAAPKPQQHANVGTRLNVKG
jgi:hypothetical protein